MFPEEYEAAQGLIDRGLVRKAGESVSGNMMVIVSTTDPTEFEMVTITRAEYNQSLRYKEKYINLDELRGADL